MYATLNAATEAPPLPAHVEKAARNMWGREDVAALRGAFAGMPPHDQDQFFYRHKQRQYRMPKSIGKIAAVFEADVFPAHEFPKAIYSGNRQVVEQLMQGIKVVNIDVEGPERVVHDPGPAIESPVVVTLTAEQTARLRGILGQEVTAFSASRG